MKTQRYETDLSDEQFALVEPFLPKPQRMGRPPADLRQVLDGILYLVRTGCQWRLLPKDFPPWSTVHTWYRRWRRDGAWENIHEALRRQVRRQAGRAPSPRSSAVDSQSVKTPSAGGESGFDAGKKVKGRKRHIWVDSLGLLLAVSVTTADVSDARAACDLLNRRAWDELPRLAVVYADKGYRANSVRPNPCGWQLKRTENTRGWRGASEVWPGRAKEWIGRRKGNEQRAASNAARPGAYQADGFQESCLCNFSMCSWSSSSLARPAK